MTFVSGVSGVSGMIRECRDGGALWAQVFGFCLRLSSATGEIVHGYERGTAGGMAFVSGLAGIPGMIRDCEDGGALRAQFWGGASGPQLHRENFSSYEQFPLTAFGGAPRG